MLLIFDNNFVTLYDRTEEEIDGTFGLGGPVFGIDYNLQIDRLYIGTGYKQQGKIRIYSISSNMAEKLYEIKVPSISGFLVYPYAQKIYLKSGHLIDLTNHQTDKGYSIEAGESYKQAAEWKLGSSELNSYSHDLQNNRISIDKQGLEMQNFELKNARLKENWGNKGVLLILNSVNVTLLYVDYQKFVPLSLDFNFQSDLSKLLKSEMNPF